MESRKSRIDQNKRSSHHVILKSIGNPKKLKVSISDERLAFIKNYIQKSRDDFFLHKSPFKDNDFYSIVASSEFAANVRYEAYLCLIENGLLTDLKLLAAEMDFSYRSSVAGEDAVLMSCKYGRIDVLHWLVDEMMRPLNVTDNDNDGPIEYAIWKGHLKLLHALTDDTTKGGFGLEFNIHTKSESLHPVMRAVFNKQFEVVNELARPVTQGGFGLSLTCRNNLNYDLPLQAADNNDWAAFATLLRPVAAGGFGLVIDKHLLKNFPYSSRKTSLQQPKYIMYIQHSGVNPESIDTLKVFDVNTQTVASYQLGRFLGSGGYGTVYEYRNAETNHAYATKITKTSGDVWLPLESSKLYLEQKRNANREYFYLCKMFPHQGPYMLQEVRKMIKGVIYYSFRMVMPLIKGNRIHDYCNNIVDASHCAEVLLQTAIALNELHKHGYIHGDIRPGNLLVETIENNKYQIRLIDFSFSKKIGKEVYYGDRDEFFAPEVQKSFVSAHPAQDTWALAKSFAWLVESDNISESVSKQMEALFPSIFDFIDMSGNHLPLKRPTLDNFIMQLSNELQSNLIKSLAVETDDMPPRSIKIG